MVLLKQRLGASSITCGCDPHNIMMRTILFASLKTRKLSLDKTQNPMTHFVTAEVIGMVYSILRIISLSTSSSQNSKFKLNR